MNYFEFCGDTGCQQYFIKAKDSKEAMEKFITWNNKFLAKEDQWPMEELKDENNYAQSNVTIIDDSCNII